MKEQITRKEVNRRFRKVYSAGYCELQFLFKYEDPIYYTCGGYGWDADIYTFGDIAIVTGYRPFGVPLEWAMVQEYEGSARAIYSDYCISYSEKERRIKALLKRFIDEITE